LDLFGGGVRWRGREDDRGGGENEKAKEAKQHRRCSCLNAIGAVENNLIQPHAPAKIADFVNARKSSIRLYCSQIK
jgi:hypothetical protein